jgi:hypothetical protein
MPYQELRTLRGGFETEEKRRMHGKFRSVYQFGHSILNMADEQVHSHVRSKRRHMENLGNDGEDTMVIEMEDCNVPNEHDGEIRFAFSLFFAFFLLSAPLLN